jgi:hypothetical protein
MNREILKELMLLSASATPGDWRMIYYDCGDTPHYDHNGPCPGIFSDTEDAAIIHWDGFKQEYWSAANGNQKQIEANAKLIALMCSENFRNEIISLIKNSRENVPYTPDEIEIQQRALERKLISLDDLLKFDRDERIEIALAALLLDKKINQEK